MDAQFGGVHSRFNVEHVFVKARLTETFLVTEYLLFWGAALVCGSALMGLITLLEQTQRLVTGDVSQSLVFPRFHYVVSCP